MKVEQRGSSYRVRKTIDGKTHTFTFDHSPTKKEIEEAVAKVIIIRENKPSDKFSRAYEIYIESKNNVLSPASIHAYKDIYKQLPESFKELRLKDIDTMAMQQLVNTLAKTYTPHTVKNSYGFVRAVIKFFDPGNTVKATLPPDLVKDPYIPTDDEVKRILAEVKGSEYEIPIALACLSLRRSEICALTSDDLEGNILTINKAMVIQDGGYIIRNHNKTKKSTRQIFIPDYLANLIREKNGKLYNGFPNSIRRYLVNVEKKLGIQEFTLHTLRHYFATYAHSIGMTDAQIQEMGGWATDNVMKRVYRRARDLEEAQNKASNHIGNMFS